MADIRFSKAYDFSFGNKTVLPYMQAATAEKALVHGEVSQVLATSIGLFDAEHQYVPFGYPVEVLLPYVAGLERLPSWEKLLFRWYGIGTADAENEVKAEDLILILDVTTKSSAEARKKANALLKKSKSVGASAIVVTQPDEKIPPELISHVGSFSGSINSYWKVFSYHPIANVLYNKLPNNIFIVGESMRVISSAIGAVDTFARFDDSNTPLILLAGKVKVDKGFHFSDFGTNLGSEEIFTAFGINVTSDIPNTADLEYSDRQVFITHI